MKTKSYVVSADIYLLLTKWAKEKNFILPGKEFFDKLRQELSVYMLQIFISFEFISEEEISKHIQGVTTESGLPVVTLDQVYCPSVYGINLTRKVDLKGEDKGLYSRFGSPSFLKQLNDLKMKGIRQICLVDDVIFSGVLIERLIKVLSGFGITVPRVCAGIGIVEGIDRISKKKKIKIDCAKIYDDVIDEVCERDFYLGIPYSGRSVVGDGNISLPYFFPFGKPGRWASIPPTFEIEFSKFCINQTVSLFEEIEKVSSKQVCCSDINRKIPTQPEYGSYINFLKSLTF